MKQSITQELDYGCGVACFAYICDMSFQQALGFLGKSYSVSHGWRPSDLKKELDRYGLSYESRYVRERCDMDFPTQTIVLIERSPAYPVGHYLALSENGWMDPWINMGDSNQLLLAQSGFRSELPGKAMYALIPRG